MRVQYAETFLQRLQGMLLGRGSRPGECLILSPCSDIHTFGMRWPIDVAFVDAQGKVLMVCKRVLPFQRLRCKKASAVVERRAQDSPWFSLGDYIPWSLARNR